MCLLQSCQGDQKTEKLLDMMLKADDSLLPAFCQALVDTGQAHVARQLGYQGELSEVLFM